MSNKSALICGLSGAWQPLPPHGACGLWQPTQYTFEKPLTQSFQLTWASVAGSGYEASASTSGAAASAKGSSAHGFAQLAEEQAASESVSSRRAAAPHAESSRKGATIVRIFSYNWVESAAIRPSSMPQGAYGTAGSPLQNDQIAGG